MRILYVSQYFPPEMGAPQARVSELSRAWAKAGHDVHVLTGMPNYPTGMLPEAYRRRILARETLDAVSVIRTWIYATPNKKILRRSVAYLSYAVSAALFGQWFAPSPDVVIATSPPILVALAGLVIARLRGAPFVFEVRDLWPESIVAVGALPADHPAVAAMRSLEELLYREADRIVVVTESFRERLSSRGVPESKIRVVTNGVDLERFTPPAERAASARTRAELGLAPEHVVCSYVGTLGMAHGLSAVLDVAARCRETDPALRFLFVGEGAERAKLEARARESGLDNVVFLGQQPRERVSELYGISDICLVPLRKSELFTTVIPSKIFEILGMARPIVLSVDGEARSIVERSGGGLFAPPEDVDAMSAAIRRLARDPALREEMGSAGRRFVAREYDREALARRYLDALAELVAARPEAREALSA
ncbi:glycosyltransferase family 4 protein [Sorangium sp. So ce375]|uniref:glycosyltransferase family 4 protein n=1 Tax=Sorangium sp. So ce375 TaxID=3133306 RepID=UPI003F5AED91